MRRELAWVVLLAVALLTVVAGPAAADHEEPTKVFETTVGDAPTPTTGFNLDGDGPLGVDRERTVATFEIPEAFDHWFAKVTEKHIEGIELKAESYLSVVDPSGHSRALDGYHCGHCVGVRVCDPPAVSCTYEDPGAEDHWGVLPARQDGTYELTLDGVGSTGEYTVTVFGFDTPR